MSDYHISVLLKDSVDGLNIDPEGMYVDVTYGGGGHSFEILKRLSTGRLFAFDQDDDAKRNLIDDDRLTFVQSNFSFMRNHLKMHGVDQVDGVLADLGVSSHQFDDADRGFSIRQEARLDMRMNALSEVDAAKIVNEYEEYELSKMFFEYADLRNARKLARAIIVARDTTVIDTTTDLMQVLGVFAPKGKENQFFAKVFQALRIEVNDELGVLKELLSQCESVLKPGGRMVVISYHSLEDRLVKNFIKRGSFSGEMEKDFYGNVLKPFKEITRKPIIPEEQEINDNKRSRSAKLRIAEKNEK